MGFEIALFQIGLGLFIAYIWDKEDEHEEELESKNA